MSNSSPMPVPIAVMMSCTSLFWRALARRAFSTLMILPRIGRTAWNSEFRACLAGPAAELPSTMNSSERCGSRDEQSASLSGRPPDSRPDLRLVRSRAFRAASRARAAVSALSTMRRASAEYRSSHSGSLVLSVRSTYDRISVFPSLVLVCPSNCGSFTLTETIAVRPSRMSSPERFGSFSLSRFLSRAN